MKIGRWQTPFEQGDLFITGLFWGGDFMLQLPGGKRYQIKNTPHPESISAWSCFIYRVKGAIGCITTRSLRFVCWMNMGCWNFGRR